MNKISARIREIFLSSNQLNITTQYPQRQPTVNDCSFIWTGQEFLLVVNLTEPRADEMITQNSFPERRTGTERLELMNPLLLLLVEIEVNTPSY